MLSNPCRGNARVRALLRAIFATGALFVGACASDSPTGTIPSCHC